MNFDDVLKRYFPENNITGINYVIIQIKDKKRPYLILPEQLNTPSRLEIILETIEDLRKIPRLANTKMQVTPAQHCDAPAAVISLQTGRDIKSAWYWMLCAAVYATDRCKGRINNVF